MQILIGSAKIMTGVAPREIKGLTTPAFLNEAKENAEKLAAYTPEELQTVLGANLEIAKENWLRYQHFGVPEAQVPAVFAYDGMVFQKLAPENWSDADLDYANAHLIIGSFLYGMLRPLDMVSRYRLEGNVELPGNGGNMFRFWQPRLTDWFIRQIKEDDGILVNLASAEFKKMVDWRRVSKEVKIITPEFYVMTDGKPKMVTVYAKMCRGAMTNWIIQNRITDPSHLPAFSYEGFEYYPSANRWLLG